MVSVSLMELFCLVLNAYVYSCFYLLTHSNGNMEDGKCTFSERLVTGILIDTATKQMKKAPIKIFLIR